LIAPTRRRPKSPTNRNAKHESWTIRGPPRSASLRGCPLG